MNEEGRKRILISSMIKLYGTFVICGPEPEVCLLLPTICAPIIPPFGAPQTCSSVSMGGMVISDCREYEVSAECVEAPQVACAGPHMRPLGEQECANIGLVLSTIRGDVAGVRKALDMGATCDTTMDLRLKLGESAPKGCQSPHAMTPLMRACELGHQDVAVALLDARACMEYADPCGWTPLCHALGNGEIDLAQMLVSRMKTEAHVRQHKGVVRKLREELLEHCEGNGGPEVVATLKEELDSSYAAPVQQQQEQKQEKQQEELLM